MLDESEGRTGSVFSLSSCNYGLIHATVST
jgi:hypothetical protein